MIGIKFEKIQTFTDFAEFRKTWYVESKAIFSKEDIDSRLSAVITDMPYDTEKAKVIQYGKDIQSFAELRHYVEVRKNITENDIPSDVASNLLAPNVSLDELDGMDLSDLIPEDLPDISDIVAASENPEEAEKRIAKQKERLQRIAEEQKAAEEAAEAKRKEEERIAAEQAAELKRLQEEEAKRLAEEKKKEEEARKKREAEERQRLLEEERQRLKEEEEAARFELERERMRIEHEQQMAALQRSREEFKQSQMYGMPMQPNGEIPMVNESRTVHQMFGPLKAPTIPNAQPVSVGGTGLKIGRKAQRRANVYVISSALAGAGGTTYAYNLAYSTQGLGDQNVLLVDLDLTEPVLQSKFGIKGQDSCIDKIFQINGVDYLRDIQYYAARVRIGGRELSVLTSNSLNYYAASDKKLLSEYDYSDLFRHLSEKYTTIIVDIGALTGLLPYQQNLLKCTDFKQIICYAAESSGRLNECIKTTFKLPYVWSAVLGRAPKTINTIMIEKTLKRSVLGLIPSQAIGFDDVELFETNGTMDLRQYWKDLATRSWRI